MNLTRVLEVVPVEDFRARLTLTDGSRVERDLAWLLLGPIFEPVRSNPAFFHQVRIEAGTLVSPNAADLCPDVVICGGPPRAERHTGVRDFTSADAA